MLCFEQIETCFTTYHIVCILIKTFLYYKHTLKFFVFDWISELQKLYKYEIFRFYHVTI